MMNQRKNNKIKLYVSLFLVTWIAFFFLEISLAYWQYRSLSSWLMASSGLASVVAGMLAVFFFDLITSSKQKDIIRFEFVEYEHRKHFLEDIRLPEYATDGSIAYDFFSPEKWQIYPGERYIFWTDVKVRLKRNEALLLSPRSSVGIKKSLMLANTIGTIDPDYYGNEGNDGNIGICLFNYGAESVMIEKGDRIAQGMVINVVRDKTSSSNKRTGGIGSTGD